MKLRDIWEKVLNYKTETFAEMYKGDSMGFRFVGDSDCGLFSMALRAGAITQAEYDFAEKEIGERQWHWAYNN